MFNEKCIEMHSGLGYYLLENELAHNSVANGRLRAGKLPLRRFPTTR